MSARTIPAEALRRFATDVFVARGMAADDALAVADGLVWADLRGVSTHGVSRLPNYCLFIERGDIDPRARPERVLDLPASVKIDGHRAAGAIAMAAGVDAAMEKARAASIGMALVARTTHTGALGRYTQAMARQGFAAIALNASQPLMVYHGSAAAAAGTNPISLAVPGAAGVPVVVDLTPAAISNGQLLQARRTGQALPAGAAADEHGRPVTDPQLAKSVLPLGGAKGSGLSLLIELLASHLAGNPIITESLAQTPEGKRHRQNALLLAIDCSRFVDPAWLAASVQRLADGIHGLPPAEGNTEGIRLPGERGDEVAAAREREGIPLPAALLAELATVGHGLRIDAARYWQSS